MSNATRIPARSISISVLAALALSLGSLESPANRSPGAAVSGTVHEFTAAATASAAGTNGIGWD
jgi:hypothetical protein